MPGSSFIRQLITIMLAVAPTVLNAVGTELLYLSGQGPDDAVEWDFRVSAGRRAGEWSTLPVPSNWEMHGFGTFQYGNVNPFTATETGEYRHRFQVPPEWDGDRIFLTFEGVMTETEVRINGTQAGAPFRGGFFTFRYEVSALLDYGGENLIEVEVRRLSSDSSVNAAENRGDYWVLAGIYRPVYLERRPAEHLQWVALHARHTGQLTANIQFTPVGGPRRLEMQLMTMGGDPVAPPVSIGLLTGQTTATQSETFPGVLPWSAEFPNLYLLEVRLLEDEQVRHVVRERFGFRTIEYVHPQGFYVNGVKVLFRGANRHEFWPTTGRAVSRDLSVADLELLKEANLNAVRTSHYPPSRHFIEECDRLGIYVLNELPGWQNRYTLAAAQPLIESMVKRDHNSPSVVLWGNGNEGGHVAGGEAEFARWDRQGRAVVRGRHGTQNGFVTTDHYPTWNDLQNHLNNANTVFMPTEVLHAMDDGGGAAGLFDFWEAMWAANNSAGCFIWAVFDEGLRRDDLGGIISVQNNNAPDGFLGPFREKEASYHGIREIWSPVQPRFSIPEAGDASLLLENRFHHTNLDQCRFLWRLGRFPGPGEASLEPFIWSASADAEAPSIAPGAQGSLPLGLPEDWRVHDALQLTAWDPHGREIFTWTWPLVSRPAVRHRVVQGTPVPSNLTIQGDRILVSAGLRTYQFSGTTGRLLEAAVEGVPVGLRDGPRLVAASSAVQENASRVDWRQEGADWVIEAIMDGSSQMKALRWRVQSNGWLRLDYRYELQGPNGWFGVTFDYPSTIDRIRWLGQGPYRIWRNRTHGQAVGTWLKTANNTRTGREWVLPEFRGYHGGLYWAQLEGAASPQVTVVSDQDLSLRLLTPSYGSTSFAPIAPPFPPGALSFLDAISPIGDKFTAAAALGPSSQVAVAAGSYSATLHFHFGALSPGGSSGTLPEPAISPAPGIYEDRVAVTLDPMVARATVHYTLDGSDPTPASPTAQPVQIAQSSTLRARSFGPEAEPSAIVSATYTITHNPPAVVSVEALSASKVAVRFSEAVDPASATNPANYAMSGGVVIHGAELVEPDLIWLNLSELASGSFALTVSDVRDLGGTPMVAPQSSTLVHDRDLVAFWRFDELEGDTASSDTLLERALSLVSHQWVEGRYANAVAFPGGQTSGGTFEAPGSDLEEFAVSVWVWIAGRGNSDFPRILSLGAGAVEFMLSFENARRTLVFNAQSHGDWIATGNPLPPNETWFHLALSFDRATSGAPAMYINGAPLAVTTKGGSTGVYRTSGPGRIGNRSDGGRAFHGRLDQFRLFNRHLAATEIASLAAEPPPSPFENWMARFPLPASARGPGEDPDRDGVVNLLEYFHGGSPIVPRSARTLSLDASATSSDMIAFVFDRALLLPGLSWRIEHSPDLSPGSWIGLESWTEEILQQDADSEHLRVLLDWPGRSTRFFRIVVTQDSP